jgi:GTP-dependent phosphoenolpyruvate carboxykinase
MSVTEAFGDVAGMIAQMNPEKVVALKASKQMSEQVEKLVMLKKEGVITLEQTAELERFLALDLFISLAKARAHILIAK